MRKTCPIVALFIFSAFVLKVFAADLTLDKIGALNTEGKVYSEWWYTGTDPILVGTAQEGKSVSIKTDGSTSSVTSDEDGSWSYYVEAGSGDHEVVISSEGESLSFTLHLGQALPVSGTSLETSQSTTPVPETGVSQILIITLSLLMITAGWYLYENRSAKRLFEEAVVRDRD